VVQRQKNILSALKNNNEMAYIRLFKSIYYYLEAITGCLTMWANTS